MIMLWAPILVDPSLHSLANRIVLLQYQLLVNIRSVLEIKRYLKTQSKNWNRYFLVFRNRYKTIKWERQIWAKNFFAQKFVQMCIYWVKVRAKAMCWVKDVRLSLFILIKKLGLNLFSWNFNSAPRFSTTQLSRTFKKYRKSWTVLLLHGIPNHSMIVAKVWCCCKKFCRKSNDSTTITIFRSQGGFIEWATFEIDQTL